MTNIKDTNINRCYTKINTLKELTVELHYSCPKDIADYYTVLLFNFVTEIQQLVDLTRVEDDTMIISKEDSECFEFINKIKEESL